MALALANSAIRLAYGIVVLVAPSKSARTAVPLAPDSDELPEARLFVRGFAAHQVAVGLYGLARARRPADRRRAMLLGAATDLVDILSAGLEARERGGVGPDLRGGIAFSSAGLISALAAAR